MGTIQIFESKSETEENILIKLLQTDIYTKQNKIKRGIVRLEHETLFFYFLLLFSVLCNTNLQIIFFCIPVSNFICISQVIILLFLY